VDMHCAARLILDRFCHKGCKTIVTQCGLSD
jgi:hypothetical protein